MANFVASGWKRDLTHFIGCCWAAQIGSLERDEWCMAITKFLAVMAKWKADIKELTPLQFMPYVAKLFKEVTGQDLQGLSHFTGWIGQGGYYHWRVVQQGLIHLVPHLAGQSMPRTPDTHPSGKPLPPKPAQTKTPSMGASGKWPDRTQPAPGGSRQEPAPVGSGQGSTSSQGGQPSTSSQGGTTTAPRQSGKSSTPHQSGGPASSNESGTPAASGGPPNRPPGREGAGDWYDMYMREMQGRISEPPAPPYPVGTAEARQGAVGQIYDRVEGKELPSHNIASRALWAYYTRVDPQTLDTWACQILCMITEYHMACMTRGSPVTSPIVPRGLEERLLPLASYAPPEDQSGATDVWVRDHQARTLRVAVLCHRLDMALSEEPASSGSLVRSRHRLGNLLAYFLGPGTAWELRFEDVVTQVLKENQRHVEVKCTKAATSLGKCNKWRTDLRVEFDATCMASDSASGSELEHRLNSLQTSLTAIEWAITKYENILKDCRMQEEEAHQEEVIFQEQEEEGDTDTEMVEEGERGDGEPSGPQGVASTEDAPPLDPTGDAISPEEDAFLMQQASQPIDPAAGSHSPRS